MGATYAIASSIAVRNSVALEPVEDALGDALAAEAGHARPARYTVRLSHWSLTWMGSHRIRWHSG